MYDGSMTSPNQTAGVSQQQKSREANLKEVGEAMAAIEAATRRILKSIDILKERRDGEMALIASLNKCAQDIELARRRLHHDVYLGDAQLAMFAVEETPAGISQPQIDEFGEM
jgi:hypothetical protein